MAEIEKELLERADVILIDTPPLMLPDAMILANRADGVILVIGYGKNRREMSVRAVEQITQAGARILGVVLNKVPQSADRYYGYKYYDYYSNQPSEERSEGRKKIQQTRHAWRNKLRQAFRSSRSVPPRAEGGSNE